MRSHTQPKAIEIAPAETDSGLTKTGHTSCCSVHLKMIFQCSSLKEGSLSFDYNLELQKDKEKKENPWA